MTITKNLMRDISELIVDGQYVGEWLITDLIANGEYIVTFDCKTATFTLINPDNDKTIKYKLALRKI